MSPTLAMEAPGASGKQVQRGIAAAQAVFARYETSAEEVASALAARDRDELTGAFIPPELVVDGGPPPKPTATARQMEIADVWFEADRAALSACYEGVSERPDGAQLVLHYPISEASGPH